MYFVAFFLDVAEVLCMKLWLFQTVFVAVEHNVVCFYASWNLFFRVKSNGLWQFLCHFAKQLAGNARLAILVVVE